MTRLFDGIARTAATAFGAPVSYTPAGGVARPVLSSFRETPIEVTDPDGHPVLIVGPTWRVQRHLVPELARGDRIRPGNGKTYSVSNIETGGSPAANATVICELERILFP